MMILFNAAFRKVAKAFTHRGPCRETDRGCHFDGSSTLPETCSHLPYCQKRGGKTTSLFKLQYITLMGQPAMICRRLSSDPDNPSSKAEGHPGDM